MARAMMNLQVETHTKDSTSLANLGGMGLTFGETDPLTQESSRKARNTVKETGLRGNPRSNVLTKELTRWTRSMGKENSNGPQETPTMGTMKMMRGMGMER